MKRVVLNCLALTVLTIAGCVLAGAQSQSAQSQGPLPQSEPSLGDYARALKKSKSQEKPASTVIDNDSLPSATTVNVVGASSSDDPNNAGKPDAKATQPQNQDDASKVKAGQSAQDRQKAYDAWKQKIDAQKERIDQLSRDLDGAKNHPTTTTTVPVWPYNQNYQDDVAEKQKALDQARAELDQMQEDAHKEGVPNSIAQ